MTTVTAGIFQFDIRKGDLSGNVKTALDGISRASAQGTDLLVLPELWSCGYDYPGLAAHAARTPDVLETLCQTARKNDLIIAGSLPEADAEGIYNTLYVVNSKGEVAGEYRKTHLFSLIGENRHFRAGSRAMVCDTAAGRIGLMLCFDLRFPELCRSLALQDAQIVIVPAQWPAARIHHWDTLLRARAIENQLFVIGANRYGADEDLIFTGHSGMISPAGDVLAFSAGPDTLITAALDLSEIERVRQPFNCLSHRIPPVYGQQ